MTKNFRDKIIAILGAALLGYYLGLSLFRGIIWDMLLKVLPPINDRHLPNNIYIGLLGAVIIALVAYILFSIFVDKRNFSTNKKCYIFLVALGIIMPLLIAGVFRIHAVNLVAEAEKTTPTEISIRLDEQGNSLMFQISSSSASGVIKSIAVQEPYLAEFGRMLRELELKEVTNEQKLGHSQLTMFIDYRVNGKWYSKIISYQPGMFEERVTGQRLAYYDNKQLEKLIEKLITDSKNINNYDPGRIFNSLTMNDGNIEKNNLTHDDFQVLVNSLSPENLIENETEGVQRIKAVLDDWVPQEETNIYGIELLQKGSAKKMGENFIIYDKLTQTLMFEEEYYNLDLNGSFAP